MERRVTIKDVAKHAGVSFKTVSNVLNGTGRMREETRKRVNNSIRELGYTVNLSARSLKKGKTKLIGLGIPDFSQPFVSYFADKVITVARSHGYGTIISTYGPGKGGFSTIMNDLSRLAADGWILFADQPLENEGAILKQPFPVVLTGDYLAYDKADLVTMPNVESIRYVTQRLIDSGCRSIALFDAPVGYKSRELILSAHEGTQQLRSKGFIQAMDSRGLRVDWDLMFAHDWSIPEDGLARVQHIIDQGSYPDAIICLTDDIALGILHGLQLHGIRVPGDVQVIGFDNVPGAQLSMPTLTTVDPYVDDYANKAIEMLIERIEGYDGPVRTLTTNFTLVERESTRLC